MQVQSCCVVARLYWRLREAAPTVLAVRAVVTILAGQSSPWWYVPVGHGKTSTRNRQGAIVGHVWVKQVSGAVVVVGLSIRAPVAFTES